MKVRFTKFYRGRKAGDVADLSDAEARKAIDAGAAEDLSADRPETMRVRFRRPATLKNADGEGQSFAAGESGVVANDDESWEVVNRGDADLVPPPGEKGQPFPPDWVTRSDETDVPAPPPVVGRANPNEPGQPGAKPAQQTPPRGAPADTGDEPNPENDKATSSQGPANKLPPAGEAQKAADKAPPKADRK